jgi:hypothetical protein
MRGSRSCRYHRQSGHRFVTVFDLTRRLGSTATRGTGSWSCNLGSNLSNTVHVFATTASDATGSANGIHGPSHEVWSSSHLRSHEGAIVPIIVPAMALYRNPERRCPCFGISMLIG